MIRGPRLLVIACMAASSCWAGLASHEVVVLVNRNSLDSKTVANHFVHIRQVPPQNVIYLDLPERALGPHAEISPAEFTRHIWEPVQAALVERKLDDHILAWIYSVDFPVRITTTPATSLMGMTFLRNEFPEDPEWVDKGRYRSPLFAGPAGPDEPAALGGSLYRFKQALNEPLPVPSMMLGYTGARGTDLETVLRVLEAGRAADRTAPRRSIYWITGEDVRAKTRAWQLAAAWTELQPVGIDARIQETLPEAPASIIGLQMGVIDVRPEEAGRFLPGAMAEHLTSFGALFHDPRQTKLTAWLRAGATASAGTVVEPYSIWTKFPHARFFAHYARGNTMLESFYLSTGSPLQLLIVGEPLACPWALPGSLMMVSIDDPPLSETASFALGRLPEIPQLRHTYRIFLNGVWVSDSAGDQVFSFDTRDLPDGYHELRAIAYADLPTVHSVMNHLALDIQNRGQAVRITAPDAQATWELYTPLTITAEVTGEPASVSLFLNEEKLAVTQPADGQVSWTIDPQMLGCGPVALQARASFGEDHMVRSRPQSITIMMADAPHPLLASRLDWGTLRWSPNRRNIRIAKDDRFEAMEAGGVFHPGNEEKFSTAFFPAMPSAQRQIGSFRARLRMPSTEQLPVTRELGGLLWNVRSDNDFDYLLIDGHPSAWVMGRCVAGNLNHAVRRGKLILTDTPYDVVLVFEEQQTTAFIDGVPLASLPHGLDKSAEAEFGVLARHAPMEFTHIQWQTRALEEE